NGNVKCWGDNGYGQLGINSTTSEAFPVKVLNLNHAVDIDGGLRHTCAVKADGSEECWGYNVDGELGDGTTTGSLTPVPVNGVHHAIATSVGDFTSCLLNSAHRVYCWGYGGLGERGDGTTTEKATHPTEVSGLVNVTKLTLGRRHGCAALASG